ncbi:iron chelate uptake ABC transporter family permease subunit [Pseudomonas sp. ABC1]|uniref:FecCD family ABC transporter permease n=1 Tax=Pseudomonas sp. ABC1 TaxID=2748080 RepID=UPI0015C3E147|nr:iron chelate uptake ABC transporter family permease subunit [Pseudomonas sp. ABC1]QLF94069.1 iron chelate uptake ABC transporter family permease subunit [Pseudomonas sp. ABC1]
MNGPGRDSIVWRRGGLSLLLRPRPLLVGTLLLLVTLVCALLALSQGRSGLTLWQVLDALFGQGGGVEQRLVLNIRLPRVLTAIFVGAALGASGAIFQSISRNPLGSPDIIGFTTGAASGAIMQIVLFGQGGLAVALAAIGGGLLTAVLVYLLSLRGGTVGGYRLVLVGIGVGSVLTALNGLLLVRGNLDNAVMANLWLAGSLNARSWLHVWPVLGGTLLLVPLAALSARRLSMIEMGDDLAHQLGIAVERTRLLMVAYAVLLAALATAAAGPIAFVALAAPQLAARLNGSRSLPLLGAALMGACLLVTADLIIQMLPLHMTLPIGRVTGMLGGLYLLWLLGRGRRTR